VEGMYVIEIAWAKVKRKEENSIFALSQLTRNDSLIK
jgi:hypothetical protein